MSRRNFEIRSFDAPQLDRPRPQEFHFRQAIDEMALRMARTDDERQYLFDRMKRAAAHSLADHIFKHCKWFEIPCPMNRLPVLELAVTINDQGSYERWLPRERALGREEATRALRAAAPYGLDEVYE